MKKLALLILSLVGSVTVSAETGDPPKEYVPMYSFNAGTILMSKYYGTIFGGTFYDGPMSFTDVNAVFKNRYGSMTATVMAGQKLDRLDTYNRDGGNEYDAGVSQSFRMGSSRFPILLDAGVLYLALYELERTHDDAFDETIRLDFPLFADRTGGAIAQPYIQAFHYHMVGNGMEDKGFIGYAGLIRNQPLGFKLFKKDLSLTLDYRMGLNAGVYDSRAGIEYFRLEVSLPFAWKKWTVTPAVIGQLQGGPHQTYVSKNEMFTTLSIRRSF
jgi:hypothetical protein